MTEILTDAEIHACLVRRSQRDGSTLQEARERLEQVARIGAVPVEYVILAEILTQEAPDLAAEVQAGRREMFPRRRLDALTELRRRQGKRAPVTERLF
jgi:hypothetical protein